MSSKDRKHTFLTNQKNFAENFFICTHPIIAIFSWPNFTMLLQLFKASKMSKNDHDFSFYFEKSLSFPFFSKENFSMTKRKSVINFILTSNNLGEVKIYQNLFLIKLFFFSTKVFFIFHPFMYKVCHIPAQMLNFAFKDMFFLTNYISYISAQTVITQPCVMIVLT